MEACSSFSQHSAFPQHTAGPWLSLPSLIHHQFTSLAWAPRCRVSRAALLPRSPPEAQPLVSPPSS